MTDYLQTNSRYWDGRYQASNVESFIFRFYGRILKFDYGIDGSKHERILDFGCGEGGALSYFDKLGFDCFGVDIARNDVKAAQAHMPHIASQFKVIDPKPDENQMFFEGIKFDVVISIQTLDFLSNSDFEKAIRCLYNNMKPGAKLYASMNGWDMYYRKYGEYVGDGLWHGHFLGWNRVARFSVRTRPQRNPSPPAAKLSVACRGETICRHPQRNSCWPLPQRANAAIRPIQRSTSTSTTAWPAASCSGLSTRSPRE